MQDEFQTIREACLCWGRGRLVIAVGWVMAPVKHTDTACTPLCSKHALLFLFFFPFLIQPKGIFLSSVKEIPAMADASGKHPGAVCCFCLGWDFTALWTVPEHDGGVELGRDFRLSVAGTETCSGEKHACQVLEMLSRSEFLPSTLSLIVELRDG